MLIKYLKLSLIKLMYDFHFMLNIIFTRYYFIIIIIKNNMLPYAYILVQYYCNLFVILPFIQFFRSIRLEKAIGKKKKNLQEVPSRMCYLSNKTKMFTQLILLPKKCFQGKLNKNKHIIIISMNTSLSPKFSIRKYYYSILKFKIRLDTCGGSSSSDLL